MPHLELHGLSTQPGPAEWFAVGLLLVGALCSIGLAVHYALRSRRSVAGAHRTTAAPAPSGGWSSMFVCLVLGLALLGVATVMITSIISA